MEALVDTFYTEEFSPNCRQTPPTCLQPSVQSIVQRNEDLISEDPHNNN